MIFVTEFILESGIVEDLVGPFNTEDEAWDWIVGKIEELRSQYPSYAPDHNREELLYMFADPADTEEPHGFVYQVVPAVAPVEVIDNGN